METADMGELWTELADGYGQSKWVAEQMCLEARSRGLPVSILRPGNMSPSAKTGSWNKSDFIYILLQARRGLEAAGLDRIGRNLILRSTLLGYVSFLDTFLS